MIGEEKKEQFCEFKNSGNRNSDPIATHNNGETQAKYPDDIVVIKRDSILHVIIHERLSRKGRVVQVYNFGDVTVNDMKYYVVQLIRKEPSFIIIHAVTNDGPYLTSQKI